MIDINLAFTLSSGVCYGPPAHHPVCRCSRRDRMRPAGAIANIPRDIFYGREFRAFLSSGAAIGLLVALIGIGPYPNILRSDPHPENSLNIMNAASSSKTLRIMLIIALIGLPVVLAFTIAIYWIIRGKVRLEKTS